MMDTDTGQVGHAGLFHKQNYQKHSMQVHNNSSDPNDSMFFCNYLTYLDFFSGPENKQFLASL